MRKTTVSPPSKMGIVIALEMETFPTETAAQFAAMALAGLAAETLRGDSNSEDARVPGGRSGRLPTEWRPEWRSIRANFGDERMLGPQANQKEPVQQGDAKRSCAGFRAERVGGDFDRFANRAENEFAIVDHHPVSAFSSNRMLPRAREAGRGFVIGQPR